MFLTGVFLCVNSSKTGFFVDHPIPHTSAAPRVRTFPPESSGVVKTATTATTTTATTTTPATPTTITFQLFEGVF
jgi:hypothetical protein